MKLESVVQAKENSPISMADALRALNRGDDLSWLPQPERGSELERALREMERDKKCQQRDS